MNNEKLYEMNVHFNFETQTWEVLEPSRLFHELGIERCD